MGGLLCGLLLCGSLLSACAGSPSPATSTVPTDIAPDILHQLALLETGDDLATQGARTAAEAAYREAAAAWPRSPAPYLCLARLYLDWNRISEGLTALDQAEWLQAPAAQIEPLRTTFYGRANDWQEVVAHGTTTLALAPSDMATRHQVALAYTALGRLGEARTEYETLLEIDDADALAHQRLGILLALSDPAAALAHLQAATTALATVLVKILEETVEQAPVFRLTRLGQACADHQEPILAAVTLEWAVTLDPTYADAQALLGETLDQLDRPEAAMTHMEAAAALAPGSALARSLLGIHYLRAGDATAARPHLEAAHDLDTQSPASSFYLAWVYADLGEYDAAEIWLAEAIRLAPEDPLIWEAVVRFCLERSPLQRAVGLEAARGLVRLVPDSGMARDLLGWAHFMNGQPAEAEEQLRQAIALEPALAVGHYHLGQVYAYQGQTQEARAAFTRASDLNTEPALAGQIERALDALP